MKTDFKPVAYFCARKDLYLGISISKEDNCVKNAFFNEKGEQISPAVKSSVRSGRYNAPYFLKHKEKYYISEFTISKIPSLT